MKDLALSLLDSIYMAIAVVHETGALKFANKAFQSTFGNQAEEWMKAGARTVGGERGWLQSFFVGGSENRSIDVEFSGRTYRVDSIQVDGAAEGTVALGFDDVTAQREAEQRKSDFTSMIVHDLRGPLSGIQGTLDFVLGAEAASTSRLDPLHEELLREAHNESERMMSLINELMDFSKIQSGNFKVENETVRLAGILKRSVRSLQSVAQRDSVFLLSAHGSDIPTMSGSPEKLTQAVINLISNSLKFTPKKGVISISAQTVRNAEGPESIVVTVTDSGIGIKPEELGKVFEKYKQSGNKAFRGGGGTGLGLYIVKQVIEAHGGAVEIASIAGVGTSMVLRLPIKRVA